MFFRKILLKGAGLTLLVTFGLLTGMGGYLRAAAQKDENAEVIERAKKEGRVVWYTTLSLGSSDVVRRKFQEKYPFLRVELNRISDEQLVNRILNEARAKAFLVDIIQVQALSMETLKNDGMIARYVSPESKVYPEGSKDPEGYWTSYYDSAKGIVYNTRQVSAKDAPKSWEDLLDPKWKGNLLMDTWEIEWYGNLLKIWGRKKGLDYMQNLAAQRPNFRTGHTLDVMLVAAGEYPVALAQNVDRAEEMRMAGAPIKWVGADPVIARTHPTSIAKNSPHPNAARLFIDYILSAEGQKVLADTKRIPSRPGVESFVSGALKGAKLYYADVGLESQYGELIKEFKKIFKPPR